jgi:hemerythrin-like domain-containing protein
MAGLTDELKKDHSEIFEMLNKVRDIGVTKKEGQSILLSVRSSILSHINREDARLYPRLKKASENDPRLKDTLDTFAKDMEAVSRGAVDFLNKHSTGGSDLEFARDFGRFYATLQLRMRKEENILYREYDRVS